MLGESYIEIINASETQLTRFIERVIRTPNKYLILTTRTIILNHAIEKYEKINRSKLTNQQFIIELDDYSKYEKGLILYNHLYFRSIKEDLYNTIINEKFYMRIIEHRNYTPRIIEFITDNRNIERYTTQEYLKFILNNLKNPTEIWRLSFKNQIDYFDRCLLLTLFTFEKEPFEAELMAAFECRLAYEKQEHNQVISSDQFNESLRVLLNGFIVSNLVNHKSQLRQFSFINPSLTDFLIGHVSNSFQEKKCILSSIIYVEQLSRFIRRPSFKSLETELQIIIRDKIVNSKINILASENQYFTENNRHVTMIETLYNYCRNVDIDTHLLNRFKQLDFTKNWSDICNELNYLLLLFERDDIPETYNYIKVNFINIIEKILVCIKDSNDALQIPILFEKYEHDYKEYTDEKGFYMITNLIEKVLENKADDLKWENEDEIIDIEDVFSLSSELSSLESELKQELLFNCEIEHNFNVDFDYNFWEAKIEENLMKKANDEASADIYDENRFNEKVIESYNENYAIDNLFIKTK